MSEEGEEVSLHVYDITGGWAARLSPSVLGKLVEGIWHTGVVVYGREFFWGGELQCLPAGRTPFGLPTKRLPLGRTFVPVELVTDFVSELRPRYTPATYSLLSNNCNNFSSELVQFLTGAAIPDYILHQADDLTSTPVGAMLRPAIESLELQMRQANGFVAAPLGLDASGQAILAAPPVPAAGQQQQQQPQLQRQIVTGAPAFVSDQGSAKPFLAKLRSRAVTPEALAEVAEVEAVLSATRDTVAGPSGARAVAHVSACLRAWPTGELAAPLFVLRALLTRPGIATHVSSARAALVQALARALSGPERGTRLLALAAHANLFATAEGEAVAAESAKSLLGAATLELVGSPDPDLRAIAAAVAYNYARCSAELRSEDITALSNALCAATIAGPIQERSSEEADYRTMVALGHLAERSTSVAKQLAQDDSLQAVLVVLSSAGEASARLAKASEEVSVVISGVADSAAGNVTGTAQQ